MLVLTRKVDESILIGSNIIITIVSIQENRVKVGVTAPKNITVIREELKEIK